MGNILCCLKKKDYEPFLDNRKYCIYCNTKFSNNEKLYKHIVTCDHKKLYKNTSLLV